MEVAVGKGLLIGLAILILGGIPLALAKKSAGGSSGGSSGGSGGSSGGSGSDDTEGWVYRDGWYTIGPDGTRLAYPKGWSIAQKKAYDEANMRGPWAT